MPGQDRTGPEGLGPKTGRGLGNCDGNTPVKNTFGCRRGFRKGFGCNRYSYLSLEQRKEMLKKELELLEKE